MKKTIFMYVFSLLFLGCGNNTHKQKTVPTDTVYHSLKGNNIIRRHYSGVLPAADCPGILYDLTLENELNYGGGAYRMSMTYIEAENGRDVTYESSGFWRTLRGDAINRDATVYQLYTDGNKDITNLLYCGDSLIMLSADFEKANSGLNYTLKLKK